MTRALALIVVAAFALAARVAPAQEAGHEGHEAHGSHREIPGDEPASGPSLYALEGAWVDQNGTPFALESLRGSPVLLVLFYGTCDSVCPLIVRDLQKIEALLPEPDRKRTRFVLVTIDPSVDTPEKLLAYAHKNELDLSRWTLLNGAAEQVRVLANVLGYKYRPTGTGQFSHTIRITVLDQDGVVVDHADGLTRPLEPIAARVSALLSPQPR